MGRRNWLSRIYSFAPSTGNANSIFLGSPDVSSTLQGTNHSIFEVEGHFDAIQIIFGNMSSSHDQVINDTRIIVPNSISDHVQDAAFAASTYQIKVGGATTFTIPKRSIVSYPNVVVSDPLYISSVDRIDIVGAKPLLGFRMLFDMASGNTHNISYFSKVGATWGTSGQIGWHSSRSGNCLTSALTGTPVSTGVSANWHILGIRYLSRKRGMTVMWVGDSITACATTAYTNHKYGGYPLLSALANSTLNNPVECINCGMSSQSAAQYQAAGTYLMPLVYPTNLIEEFWSPNSTTPGASLPSGITSCINEQATLFSNAAAIGVSRAMWNGIPECTDATGTVSAYSVSDDTLRLNALATQAALGYPTLDFNSVVKDGSTPQRFQMVANGNARNFTDDGLHPNQNCDDYALTPAATTFVASLASSFRNPSHVEYQVRIPGGRFLNGLTGVYNVRIPGSTMFNDAAPSGGAALSGMGRKTSLALSISIS